jgi:hypothetical protein
MSQTSQIKTSGGAEQRNDQPEIANDEQDADTDGGVAGRVPTPSITQRQAIILAAVAAVLVAVYLYTRTRDGDDDGGLTASAYAERDGGEGFQEAAAEDDSPDGVDLDELEQASETGVAADRQVVNWMQDRGRLASED